MKIYYDCEFLENGETIRLISIGMVAEDGREFYAIARPSFQLEDDIRSHPWLRKNVYNHLPKDGDGFVDRDHPDVMQDYEIRNKVRDFVLSTPDPELWADYAAYDHVALCQLFGRMIDLPDGFPMFTHELQQVVRKVPGQRPVQSTGEHNALEDARYNMQLGKWAGL